jgi:hypothetical protein
LRRAEAQARQKADEEIQELHELEAAYENARVEAEQRNERKQILTERLDTLQSTSSAESNFAAAPTSGDVVLTVDEDTTLAKRDEAPGEELWLSIDIDQAKSHSKKTDDDLVIGFEPSVSEHDNGTGRHSSELVGVAEIGERLQSDDPSQRAAALAELAGASAERSFALITKSFDDPSEDVRNAAARALYGLQADLAASFTRALREASSERRRRIGSAIAGSGLAAAAIDGLTEAGGSRTYSAFSILFLMAKAGEIQPLMDAIEKHPSTEVRLSSVKLLALSNQRHVLPGLRSLFSSDTLPAAVHTAVMEAIYFLSNRFREVTQPAVLA